MSKQARKTVPPGRTVGPYQRAEVLLAQRDRQLAEIEALRRSRGKLTSFSRKAHTLLTRVWARGSWKTREELVRASAWLMYLDHLRDVAGL
ncbi:MAG: hypothetical protein K2X43_15890 [Hyphomonadaceae bacterium]|nr:hypothetical protein [Hyphomonadaceae bacterium]